MASFSDNHVVHAGYRQELKSNQLLANRECQSMGCNFGIPCMLEFYYQITVPLLWKLESA
jgi:hypothetical protein